jgi:hypothetical protein
VRKRAADPGNCLSVNRVQDVREACSRANKGDKDKVSKIAHYAMDNDLTLKAAALKLGFVTEDEFDRVVDPAKIVKSYAATDK